jgi:inosose dehydratase
VFEPFHDPARREASLALARAVSERVRSLGGRFLVLIDLVSPERASTAGRACAARRLTGDVRRTMVGVLREAAAIARDHGLRAVVHPHAGSYIEFEDEIERIAEEFELCLDTGHLAYAGVDPAAAYRRWAERTPYLHLKDFSRGLRGPDFWSSVRAGAFRPLGSGDVDVTGVVRALDDHGFAGWVVIEQDRVPGGDPVRDLVASRRALERLR